MLAGTALRRVVPAMAVTLAGYAAIRLPVEFVARPRYLPALRMWGVPFSPGSSPLARDDWELGIDPVAPGGHTVLTGAQFDRLQQVATATMNRNTVTPATFMARLYRWLTAHGYTQVATYQPASRCWLFQGIEAAICLAAALTALAVAYHLVTRRRALTTVRLENTGRPGRSRPLRRISYFDWGSFAVALRGRRDDGGGTTGPMSPSGASSRSAITGA